MGFKMAEIWTSVKDYAEKHGITIQAVYQQINRKQNKEFIAQHSKKIQGVKHLDEEAVKFLESKRENSPAVIVQSDDRERIAQLEAEKEALFLKVVELQEIIMKKSEKIEQLQEANIQLLEDKAKKAEEPRKWWEFWK